MLFLETKTIDHCNVTFKTSSIRTCRNGPHAYQTFNETANTRRPCHCFLISVTNSRNFHVKSPICHILPLSMGLSTRIQFVLMQNCTNMRVREGKIQSQRALTRNDQNTFPTRAALLVSYCRDMAGAPLALIHYRTFDMKLLQATHAKTSWLKTFPNARTQKRCFSPRTPTKVSEANRECRRRELRNIGDFPTALFQKNWKIRLQISLFTNFGGNKQIKYYEIFASCRIHYIQILIQGSLSLWEGCDPSFEFKKQKMW